MANYMTIAKLVNFLPKCEGASTRMRLSGKQLTQMMDKVAQKEPVLEEALRIQLGRAKNPVLEIGAKAKSNYSIAGFRLFDGKKVLGQGAVSLSNVGTNQSVVKVRNSVGSDILGSSRPLLGSSNGLAEGQSAIARGFLDCGKPTNAKDLEYFAARQKGMITAEGHIGQNFGVSVVAREKDAIAEWRKMPLIGEHVDETLAKLDQAGLKECGIGIKRTGDVTSATINAGKIGEFELNVNEGNLVNAARILDVNPKFLERYAKGSKNLQRNIDAVMVDIRKALRGEAKAPAPATPEPTTAEVANVFKPVKPLDLEKAFRAKTLACDEKILKVDKIRLKEFQAEMDAIKKKYEL